MIYDSLFVKVQDSLTEYADNLIDTVVSKYKELGEEAAALINEEQVKQMKAEIISNTQDTFALTAAISLIMEKLNISEKEIDDFLVVYRDKLKDDFDKLSEAFSQ